MDKAKRSKRVKYWIYYRLPCGKQRTEFVGISLQDARDAEGKRRGQKREGRIFEMLPDLDSLYHDWLNQPLPDESPDWFIDKTNEKPAEWVKEG